MIPAPPVSGRGGVSFTAEYHASAIHRKSTP